MTRSSLEQERWDNVARALAEFKAGIGAIDKRLTDFDNERVRKLEVEVAVMRDRAGRTGALWGTVCGALVSGAVAAFLRMLSA